jgi:hypothetical protein
MPPFRQFPLRNRLALDRYTDIILISIDFRVKAGDSVLMEICADWHVFQNVLIRIRYSEINSMTKQPQATVT